MNFTDNIFQAKRILFLPNEESTKINFDILFRKEKFNQFKKRDRKLKTIRKKIVRGFQSTIIHIFTNML